MTRAKRHLALLVPQRFHVTQQAKYGDRHLYASLTRFIAPEVAALFDRDGPTCDTTAPLLHTLPAAIDVAAQVRGLF